MMPRKESRPSCRSGRRSGQANDWGKHGNDQAQCCRSGHPVRIAASWFHRLALEAGASSRCLRHWFHRFVNRYCNGCATWAGSHRHSPWAGNSRDGVCLGKRLVEICQAAPRKLKLTRRKSTTTHKGSLRRDRLKVDREDCAELWSLGNRLEMEPVKR